MRERKIVKRKILRWTVELGAAEFEIDHRSLRKRLNGQGAVPGKDGKFSTHQIASAVYGDLAGEKLRKVTAERELLELELARERSDVIPTKLGAGLLESVVMHIRQVVRGSLLSDSEKNEVLRNIRSINIDAIFNKHIQLSGQLKGEAEPSEVATKADGG